MKLFIINILLFISYLNLSAKALDLQKDSLVYFGKNIEYLEDEKSQLTIEEIYNNEKINFKKLNKEVHSEKFTSSSFWYKFEIDNSSQKNIKKYFVFDLPWLDHIEIYVYNKNQKDSYLIGSMHEFEKRSLQVNLLNQEHEFKKGVSQVFIKVKTRDPFVVPLSILSKSQFKDKINFEEKLEYSLYSIIFVMFFFNLMLFFIIKQKAYLYYIFFLGSFVVMSLSYNSYLFEHLIPKSPDLHNWLQSFTIFVFCISGLLFAKSFLKLKSNFKRLNKLTNKVIYTFVVLMILTPIFDYATHITLAISLSIVFTIYVFGITLYTLLNGNKSALLFLIGTIAGLVGITITAFSVLSIIPYDWYLYRAVDIGILIDSVMMSLALAYRYVLLHENLEQTQTKLNLLNNSLEKKVRKRTKKLSLELKNKNVLLRELSHRVKNNLQIVSALFSMQGKNIKDKQFRVIIDENVKRINSISILYEKLIMSSDLEKIDLKLYIESIIQSFSQTIDAEGIEFEVNIPEIKLQTDLMIPLGLAINELITNSSKYAFTQDQEYKKINIYVYFFNNALKVNFWDNGVGANLDAIKKGFGSKLLNSLIVYQLDGQMDYYNQNGLRYEMIFPHIKKEQ